MSFILADAKGLGGIVAQMPVGQKKHAVALIQSPAHHDFGIGRGAHRAAKFAHHGLEGQIGIHIGQRYDLAPHGCQLLQHLAGKGGWRLSRHKAVGVQTWQVHALTGFGKQSGRFAHKIHTAKNDVGRLDAGNAPGQLERIAGDVAVAHDGVVLVVVAHDAQIRAQLLFQACDGCACILDSMIPQKQYGKRSDRYGNLFR